MKTKSLSRVAIKDADEGLVTAVFATLGVKDHDGDVIVKGAITDGQPVRISAYGHRSWSGALPVGKGVVREVGDEAIFEGRFFLDTSDGRDTFTTVKELGDLQEWSFSLEDVTSERGELDGEPVTYIKQVSITEVSPVLKGAGINTRTLATKQHEGLKFSEHIDAVLADVRALGDRAQEVVALRAEKGKAISETSAAGLVAVSEELKRLKELLAEPEPDPSTDELTRVYLRLVARNQGAIA